ncbi:MAG: hypothetical protein OXE57_02580 [Alphaproteobacteria bacterium]|nr:hypothetical protein [Alphaproteobacteria bacterium]
MRIEAIELGDEQSRQFKDGIMTSAIAVPGNAANMFLPRMRM